MKRALGRSALPVAAGDRGRARRARAVALAAFAVLAPLPAPAVPVGVCAAPPPVAALAEGRSIIHVATTGDDRWSGRVATPAADGSDGPVASLRTARDRARAGGGEAAIVLHGGDYFLSEPVTFGPEDAGLHILAAPGEVPVLHGGVPVTGWTDAGGGVWSVPMDRPLGAFYIDGRPQTMARHPNLPAGATPRDGWLFAAAPPDGAATNTTFSFQKGDIPPLADLTGLVVTIVGGFYPGTQWGSDSLPVQAIDRDALLVQMTGTGYFFTGEGSRYYLMGRPEFLDMPGEWAFDAAAHRLLYRPDGPFGPEARGATGVIGTFLQLSGASGMVIAGLEFRDSIHEGSGKYGTDTRGFGAVRVENADAVRILGNRFRNLGVGIHVAESDGVEILGNDMDGIAGNGIYLGTSWGSFGRSDDPVIAGNRIRRVGQVFFESAGIWLQASDRFRVEDNLVEDAAQFGILAGSLWGEQDASHDGLIEGNIVRDANRQTADGGAIKLMGAQGDRQRITIRRNLVTGTDALMNRADGSFWPARHEDILEWPGPISWAIYLDGRASGNTIADNTLVGNVTAIGVNGGWSNLVTGNLVQDSAGSVVRIDDATGRGWKPDWAAPNEIRGNRFEIARGDGRAVDVNVPDHGRAFMQFSGNTWSGTLSDESFRVIPRVMGFHAFGSLARFRAAGEDTDGSIAEAAPVSGKPTGAASPCH